MKPCPNCNEQVPETAKVCGHCGTRLVDVEPAAPAAPPVDPAPRPSATTSDLDPKPRKGAGTILITLIALAAIGTGAWAVATQPWNDDVRTLDTTVPAGAATTSTAIRAPEPSNRSIESAVYDHVVGTGRATFGTAAGRLPFSDNSTGSWQGFEIEIGEEIAGRVFGPSVDVEWVELSAADRFDALAAGEIDILFRLTAATTSREGSLTTFSVPYLLDAQALLLPRSLGRRGIDTVAELEGAIVAVSNVESTYEWGVIDFLEASGMTVELDHDGGTCDPVLVDSGTVDACVTDWTFALWTAAEQPDMEVIPLFPVYGLAAGAPFGDDALADAISEAIRSMVSDGTWNAIAEQWLPDNLQWTTGDMLSFPLWER